MFADFKTQLQEKSDSACNFCVNSYSPNNAIQRTVKRDQESMLEWNNYCAHMNYGVHSMKPLRNYYLLYNIE